ncbi:MAG: VIT1/CCC1 transporter family protein [Caldilineaceae bacterium]
MSSDSVLARVRRSFDASAGEIVFGMEDGAVSIFGLVFGVAATTDQNSAVLIAGISGAFAAAVSMMAGVFLDRQSESDQERIHKTAIAAAIQANPEQATGQLLQQLMKAGVDDATANEVVGAVRRQPAALTGLATLAAVGSDDEAPQGPLAHATWMLFADLSASLLPVIPFALLSMESARVASVLLTAILMLALGAWRARLGQRPTLVTALQTLGIAAAAGIVGVAVGHGVDIWFGG